MNRSTAVKRRQLVRNVSALFVGGAVLAGGLASNAVAASLFWSANGTTAGGAGTWDTTEQRWGALFVGPFATVWNNTNNDTPIFSGTAGAVALGNNISVGGLTFHTTGYSLTTGANTLSFSAANNTILFNNVAAATITGAVGGAGNVTLVPVYLPTVGTLTLNGTSAGGWTGSTTVNAGTVLALSGLNQGLLNTSSIALQGGGITLISADDLAQDDLDRVNDSAAITSNGGTITYTTTTAASTKAFLETIGTVSLTTGQLNLVNTLDKSAGSQTLALSGLTRTGTTNSSAITFSNAGGLNTTNDLIQINGIATSTAANQIIGSWATVGTSAAAQTDYAVYNSDGTNGRIVAANIAASDQSSWTTPDNAYTVNAGSSTGGSAGLSATRTVAALRSITGALAMTVDNTTDTFTLASNTFANGDAFVLGGTAPTGLTAGSTYYVVNKSGNDFQLATTPGGTALDFTSNGTSVTATGAITLSTGNNLETNGLLNGVSTIMYVVGTGAVTTPAGGGNLHVNAGSGGITISAPINNNAGAVTLVKNGANLVLLNSTTSNYSGGTIINAGQLRIATDAALGSSSGSITLNGGVLVGNTTNPQVGNSGGINIASARDVIVGVAGGGIGAHGNNNFTTTGKLSGAGTFTFTDVGGSGGRALNFNATTNDFTGRLVIGSNAMTVQVNSLADAVGAGNISLQLLGTNNSGSTFTYGTGATAALTLNNRAIELNAAGTFAGTINNANTNTARPVTINTDLVATGAGAKTLTLSAAAGPTNVFAGNITNGTDGGTVAVSKTGGGTWTLSGNNSFSGGVSLSGATAGSRLNINSATALGTGALTISGGDNATIGNTSGTDITLTTNNAQTWSNNFAVVVPNSLNMGTGTVTMGGSRTINVTGAGVFTVGGNISGTGFSLTKTGSGTLTLSGTNTYSGGTTIGNNTANVGTVNITNSSALGTGAVSIISNSGNSNFATLTLNSATGITVANNFTTSGAGQGGNGLIRNVTGNNQLTGNFTLAGGGGNTQIQSDGGTLTLSGTLAPNTTARVLVLSGSATGIVSGTINDGTGVNTLSGLTKQGSGTWTLSGTNTYTGATTVSAGKLVINGNQSTATGLVTVAAGGTLGGTGTVGGAVAVNGTLAPGNSPGVQTYNAGITFNTGSTFEAELLGATLGNGTIGYDSAVVTAGNVVIDPSTILSLPTPGGNDYTLGSNLWIINNTGAGSLTGNFAGLPNDTQVAALNGLGGYNWKIFYGADQGTGNLTGGNDVVLNAFEVIPEPSTVVLGGLALLGLAGVHLRRRRLAK